jgi:hypothetical protein
VGFFIIFFIKYLEVLMSYIKKLLITSILVTTLCPSLFAMQDPVSAEIQLAFQKALDVHDFEQADICLQQGANLNTAFKNASPEQRKASEYYAQPVLGHYAQFGTAEQVAFLLEHGADPLYYHNDPKYSPQKRGWHALQESLLNSTANALKIIPLLAEKVGVDYLVDATPLFFALYRITATDKARKINIDISVVELLLQLGADPNQLTVRGTSPGQVHYGEDTLLDRALPRAPGSPDLWRLNFPLVKLLCQYGAQTRTERLSEYLTPVQMAEIEQVREQIREKSALVCQDCDYLELPYPYPKDSQLQEDQLPYKVLYNNELERYLPLPEVLVGMSTDYSDNARFDALLARAALVAASDERKQDPEPEPVLEPEQAEEAWCSIS